MHPVIARLLHMMILAHLAGVAAKAPMPPQPKGRQPGGGGAPQAQGAQGVGQARHGFGAAARGGTAGRGNALGTLPHQQANPYALLLGHKP